MHPKLLLQGVGRLIFLLSVYDLIRGAPTNVEENMTAHTQFARMKSRREMLSCCTEQYYQSRYRVFLGSEDDLYKNSRTTTIL